MAQPDWVVGSHDHPAPSLVARTMESSPDSSRVRLSHKTHERKGLWYEERACHLREGVHTGLTQTGMM